MMIMKGKNKEIKLKSLYNKRIKPKTEQGTTTRKINKRAYTTTMRQNERTIKEHGRKETQVNSGEELTAAFLQYKGTSLPPEEETLRKMLTL